jgi:hypothetical protein
MTARRCLLTTVAFLTVVILQLAHTVQTRADDGVPPEETPVVATTKAAPDETPTEESTPDATAEPTDEAMPNPTDEITPEPTDETMPNPTDEITPEPTDETTPESTEEAAPEDEAAPESEDESEPDPEADADSFSDPIWCPEGQVPGNPGCTPPQPTITELIVFLQANAATYNGNGTIYFEGGTYSGPEASIELSNIDLPDLGTITIFGGWDLDPNGGYDGNTGTTTFEVPLRVWWDAAVTLIDLIIDLDGGGSDAGIFVEADGDITVDNVVVTGGASGAILSNYAGVGNVTVTNSEFSDNANNGLQIYSSGNVTITDVVTNGNKTGIFIDNSTGTGDVVINNVFAYGNGWTGVDVRSAGDITLDNVTANGNLVGANLQTTAGAGNIFVSGSTFNGNDDIGLKAVTNEGNITVTDVNIDAENEPGSFGAWLKTYGGGTITVTGGSFNNADTGLFVVGTDDVVITDVEASGNAGNGVEVLSGWVFACIPPDGIDVTVTGGTYHDNGGYGVYVAPGPNGTGTVDSLADYLNNAAGDFLVDLERTCQPPPDKEPGKPWYVVEVTGEGDDPVTVDCEIYAGVIMIFPDGKRVKMACPVNEELIGADVSPDDLPGVPPADATLVNTLSISYDDMLLLPDGYLQITFPVPEDLLGKHFSILYWDASANDGEGGWVEMPVGQFGGQVFPLHPDTPEDGLKILSGVCAGCGVTVKVNFTGIFILVVR